MKPAICMLCGKPCKDEKSSDRGDWVRFSDYKQPEQTSLDDPVGLEYFCDDHIAAARELASKSSKEAIAMLKQKRGVSLSSPISKPQPEKGSWWRRLFFRIKTADNENKLKQ